MLGFSTLCGPNEQKFGTLLTWPKVISPSNFLPNLSTESWETQHLKAKKHKPKFEFRTLQLCWIKEMFSVQFLCILVTRICSSVNFVTKMVRKESLPSVGRIHIGNTYCAYYVVKGPPVSKNLPWESTFISHGFRKTSEGWHKTTIASKYFVGYPGWLFHGTYV